MNQRTYITPSNIHACTTAGIGLNQLRKHIQNRFKTDEITATWVTGIFLETLPLAIEDDPDLVKELEMLVLEISSYLQEGAKKSNEAINN
jgi:hypothetical protein